MGFPGAFCLFVHFLPHRRVEKICPWKCLWGCSCKAVCPPAGISASPIWRPPLGEHSAGGCSVYEFELLFEAHICLKKLHGTGRYLFRCRSSFRPTRRPIQVTCQRSQQNGLQLLQICCLTSEAVGQTVPCWLQSGSPAPRKTGKRFGIPARCSQRTCGWKMRKTVLLFTSPSEEGSAKSSWPWPWGWRWESRGHFCGNLWNSLPIHRSPPWSEEQP